MTVLQTFAVSRAFDDFLAVDSISLAVKGGEITALLGPNGAGKTTFVKMCSTLLTPTTGRILVDGADAVSSPASARRKLGLMLGGELGFYGRASVVDNLRFFADVAGVSRSRAQAVERALEVVGLADVPTRKVNHLSRGMRQRLHLARAIIADPPLLILDEPSTGLDPEIALEMRKLIQAIADAGTGVLLTTHAMSEAEALANRLVVIGAGRVVVDGAVADVAKAADIGLVTHFSLPLTSPVPPLQSEAIAATSTEIHGESYRIRISWRAKSTAAVVEKVLSSLPDDAFDLITRPAHLEEAYLALASSLQRAER